jgi:hypothetical protein
MPRLYRLPSSVRPGGQRKPDQLSRPPYHPPVRQTGGRSLQRISVAATTLFPSPPTIHGLF